MMAGFASLRVTVARIVFPFVTILVFILGIGIRLFDLLDPPLDFHATRQLRSALIARAVYYRLDSNADAERRALAADLAALEIYEPPILEWIVGTTYWIVGGEHVWIARIYNSLFWGLGGLALWLVGRRFCSRWVALLGLAFYFFLPFSVIASRSFQPEPWMVMWILLTLWSLFRYCERPGWGRVALVGIFGAMALLVKVVAGFFLLPMVIGAAISALGLRRFWREIPVWTMGALIALPVVIYYLAFAPIQRSGEFLSFWTVSLSGLVLTSNFYADWLAMVQGLAGLMGLLLAIVGMTLAEKRARALLLAGWVGYGLYGLAFPYQYVTHEYYHLPLVALVSLSILPLGEAIFERLRTQSWFWQALATGAILFACFYSLYVSRSILVAGDYRNEPIAWQRVGQAIPAGHSFVGLTADYGMRLRYYGWRNMGASWPTGADQRLFKLAGQDEMDVNGFFQEFTRGKDFFLVTAFSELDAQPELKALLYQNYPVFAQGDGFILFDLRKR